MMRLGTHLECIGSSSKVSKVYHDSTREFIGRRPRLAGRLSRVAERLAGSWEGFDLYPKELNSKRRCASRRRNWEVDAKVKAEPL
ncbi:hypothetical protein GW17_00049061 [Ensete ventricosum]|nr:hypothetical protein GW17_00049061 [Ensete ventricosum]RZS16867.1 hypothetical protein BHM03_00048934 [Ensete ventricosum]